MAQAVGAGQGEPFGQGGQQLAELDPPQQRPEPAVSPPAPAITPELRSLLAGAVTAKWAGSRANRGGGMPGSGGVCGRCWPSVPRASIRPIRGTLMASASKARAQAASTRAGPHLRASPSSA